MGVTPVPIPNTMVKTQSADGTTLETAWESRWVPDFYFNRENLIFAERSRCEASARFELAWAEQKAKRAATRACSSAG